MLAVMVGTTFVACGDDNDEGGSSSGIPSPVLTDAGGNKLQVTAAGDYWYRYDENGKLSRFYDGGSVYTLDGDNFAINFSSSEGAYFFKFFTNGNGLMTKMEIGCDLKFSNGGWDKQNITFSYQYNSSKQLTRESISGSGNFYYPENTDSEDFDYGKVKETLTGEASFTWAEGNLVSLSGQAQRKGTRDGQAFTEEPTTSTQTYTYGSQANAFRQFPVSMGDLADDFFSLFCAVGLFGVGPAYLPTAYTENQTEDGESWTESAKFWFTLNNDGSINTEQREYERRISYQYNNIETRAGSANPTGIEHLKSAIERYFEKSHTGKRCMK